MPDHRDESPLGRGYGTGWAIVGAGFQLVFSILLFMGLGYLADRWLGSRPVLMLIGLALGLGAGFYAFWLRVVSASRQDGS
jgi:F0F1-type ATP synthase assembly protein I